MGNWIVAFGDSFTYGDELPDELIAIGNHDFGKIIKRAIKEYPDMKEKTYSERNLWLNVNRSDYNQLCNDMSYINLTSCRLDIGSINHAFKGRSLQNILIDIINYFKHNTPSGEIFVVGVGVWPRQTRYEQPKDKYCSENWRFLINLENTHNDNLIDFAVENLLDMEYQTYLTDSIVKKISSIFEEKNVPYYVFDVQQKLNEITDKYSIPRCAFGHPGPLAHDILSGELANELKKFL